MTTAPMSTHATTLCNDLYCMSAGNDCCAPQVHNYMYSYRSAVQACRVYSKPAPHTAHLPMDS